MTRHLKNSDMVSLIIAFTIAGGSLAFAFGQQPRAENINGRTQEEILLNANSIIGNTVIGQKGKTMGIIKDLMIDQGTGQIAYMVLGYGGTFGGTLGSNQENYSIPWKDINLINNAHGDMVIQVVTPPMGERVRKQPRAEQDRNVFDSNNIESIEGTIESIYTELSQKDIARTESLVVLDVQSESGRDRVQIAPDDYLKKQGIEMNEGDSVKVVGSRMTQKGQNLLLATKLILTKNGKELALREHDGTPKWNQMREISAISKGFK